MSFWDTSAPAKLYVPEADSAFFQQHAAQTAAITVARLALLEMRRVAHQKETDGLLQKGGAELILQQLTTDAQSGRLNIVELRTEVEQDFARIMSQCYAKSPPIQLRTLDGLHLASARVAGETEFVVTDRRLRDAALAMGFAVFPP